jgi:hypothetical protein
LSSRRAPERSGLRPLALLAVLLTACAGLAPPAPAPETPLERADRLFEEKRYAEAVAEYTAWLAENGTAPPADHVLLRLALARLSSGTRVYDPEAARALLRRLVRDFPDSPYRPAVELILGWHRDLDRVREQLEELKKIDLTEPEDPG